MYRSINQYCTWLEVDWGPRGQVSLPTPLSFGLSLLLSDLSSSTFPQYLLPSLSMMLCPFHDQLQYSEGPNAIKQLELQRTDLGNHWRQKGGVIPCLIPSFPVIFLPTECYSTVCTVQSIHLRAGWPQYRLGTKRPGQESSKTLDLFPFLTNWLWHPVCAL